jgi:membrane-associated phospholipid phosphatase
MHLMLFNIDGSKPSDPLTSGPRAPKLRGLSALAAIAAALLCPLTMQFDAPLSGFLRSWDLPGDLEKAINLSEAFAHGFGVSIILLTVWIISVERRQAIAVAMLITLASGGLANGLKAAVVRVRPHSEGLEVMGQEVSGQNPTAVQRSFWDERQRSFPSGHTATAWGLAIGLGLVYSRGWIMFVLLASLASLQRMTSGAHYPSDVLAGMAIAFLCVVCMLSIPSIRRLLEH